MTKEDKELLLKDICARIPYGVKILHEGWNYEWDDELSTVERVVGIDENFIYTKVIDTHTSEEYRDDRHPISTFDDKLFLRPMSSMTEEEKRHISKMMCLRTYDDGVVHDMTYPVYTPYYVMEDCLSYLRSIHVDYSGLIEKGLALVAPEGMYQ